MMKACVDSSLHIVVIWVFSSLVVDAATTGYYEWGAWSRATPCSVTCGQGTTSRTRYCQLVNIASRNTSFTGTEEGCSGPTEQHSPCYELACPIQTLCSCGCTMTEASGNITSELTYDTNRQCKWKIKVPKDSRIRLTVRKLNLKQGNLKIQTGKKKEKTLRRLFEESSEDEKFPFMLISDANTVNITLLFYKTNVALDGKIRFEASYQELTPPPPPRIPKPQTLKSSAVIGIAACGIIIFLATFILVYRYCKQSRLKQEETIEEADDGASSNSGSNRSRPKGVTQQKIMYNGNGAQQRLIQGNKMTPCKSTADSKDSAYESDNKRLISDGNNSLTRNQTYSDQQYVSTMGVTPHTTTYWPPQNRRMSGDMDYHQSMNHQIVSQQNQQSQAPVNIHIPHPQLGYMIRQAQLSFPTQVVPSHMYQQQNGYPQQVSGYPQNNRQVYPQNNGAMYPQNGRPYPQNAGPMYSQSNGQSYVQNNRQAIYSDTSDDLSDRTFSSGRV